MGVSNAYVNEILNHYRQIIKQDYSRYQVKDYDEWISEKWLKIRELENDRYFKEKLSATIQDAAEEIRKARITLLRNDIEVLREIRDEHDKKL